MNLIRRLFGGRRYGAIEPEKQQPVVTGSSWGLSGDQRWIFVGDSVQGYNHVASGLPCQDCYNALSLDRNWQLMVTSDGAGSSINSQRGSAALCTNIVPRLISGLFETGELNLNAGLPSREDWARVGGVAFRRMREEVIRIAESQGMDPAEYNSTISIAIFSEAGLLIGHVGDGRGAYLKSNNEWAASMLPHKGEEPNQTVFLNSKWDTLEFAPNGAPLPEFSVFEGPIRAVALLTDGMEKHAFQCSVIDPATSQWSDPNIPYPRFFSPLHSIVLNSSTQQGDLNEAWTRFLTEGTPALKMEHDDKTLVLACLLDESHT